MNQSMKGLTFVVVVLALVALLVAISPLQALAPKPIQQPINGYYDYRPGVGITSTYRISYSIPNPINITQPQTLSIMFNASTLVGQTSAVEVHSTNLTFVTNDNRLLFTQIIQDDKSLNQGQVWGPKRIQFVIDNGTLQLPKGSETVAKVLISVSFDEILKVSYVIGLYQQQYTKSALLPALEVTLRSPVAALQPSYHFDFYGSLVTLGFFGGIVFAGQNLVAVLNGLPSRDTRLRSGYRDRTNGRAVGRLAAYKAFSSVLLGLTFVVLANFGAAGYQMNLLKMVTDAHLGRPDVEVLISAILWMSGGLLGRLR